MVKRLTSVSAQRRLSTIYSDVLTKSTARLLPREQAALFFVFALRVAVKECEHG